MIGTAEWFVDRENIYKERNQRIDDACNNLLKPSNTHPRLFKSSTPGNNFWFDLPHHLAVCMHSKVSAYMTERVTYLTNAQWIKFSPRLVVQLGKEICFCSQTCQRNKKCWLTHLIDSTISRLESALMLFFQIRYILWRRKFSRTHSKISLFSVGRKRIWCWKI